MFEVISFLSERADPVTVKHSFASATAHKSASVLCVLSFPFYLLIDRFVLFWWGLGLVLALYVAIS